MGTSPVEGDPRKIALDFAPFRNVETRDSAVADGKRR
jgi:hypothetical protein